MWCESCAYYLKAPNPAVCRRCGRYLSNKYSQLAIILILSIALAVFSHYTLVGQPMGGSRLAWVRSGLAVPYSVYASPYHFAGMTLMLGALVMIPALVTHHYGMGAGAVTGLIMGLFSGLHLGWLLLTIVGVGAVGKRTRAVPAGIWPVLAALGGALYYVLLAWRFGPTDEAASAALYRFLAVAAVLAVGGTAVAAAVAALVRHNSLQAVATVAFLTLAPMLIFFRWVGPARLEASALLYMHDPSRTLAAKLPEGFVRGAGGDGRFGMGQERQLGHFLDTLRYVDAQRARTIEACDAYLRRHSVGADAAEVMLLKAQMYNARVDLEALKRYGRLEAYYDRIAKGALATYGEIIDRLPQSQQAALARYRLAEGTFQAGDVMQAQKFFAEAKAALEAALEASEAATPGRTDVRESEMPARLKGALVATKRRLSLIANNSDFGGQPLARFAQLDPRDETFAVEAGKILTTYRESEACDNMRLALAEALADPLERRAALEALLESAATSDERDRMLSVTAQAQAGANIKGDGLKRAELNLRRLLADFPESTYADEARGLLARVSAGSEPGAAKN
jgi:TolA-binding protein